MTTTPFETRLYQQLNDFFSHAGYTLLAEKKQFRKTTPGGFQNVIFSPAFYGTETRLDVTFGCRSEQVEQIAQQFLNNLSDFWPDANTLIIDIGKFQDSPFFRYTLHKATDLAAVCGQIQDFFSQQGFPFVDHSGTLPRLDELLNQLPLQPSKFVYNQTHRCYKGLIVAYLNHNPQIAELTDSYRHGLLRQTQNRYEQRNFERLVLYLQHYSAN